jgi:hypothetical protein
VIDAMKISYSQLLNIVLAIILITSVFFMKTESTIETKTANAVTYDPWLDYNEDGFIGIDDIYNTASSFGAEGDPTKNVNVTNWPEPHQELRIVYNESIGSIPNDPFGVTYVTTVDLTGYKTMVVHAKAVGTWQSQCNLNLIIAWNSGGIVTYDFDVGFNTDVNQERKPWYGTATTYVNQLAVIRSTKLDLYLYSYNSNPPVNITLLTIAVYLTN